MHLLKDLLSKLMQVQISISELYQLSKDILIKNGVPEDQAHIIADSIVFAHRTGKGTHGITRLPIYVRKIQNGNMTADTQLKLVSEFAAVSVLDAGHGFGQVAAWKAMDIAIEKAETFGVGVVGVRHSNNFGTASFFIKKAVDANKVAMLFSNSAPAIAPWGGSKPLFGTNPIAFGFPAPDGHAPIILDMAVSQAARGKIRLAAKNGEKIPFGWALDENGQPTNNPHDALKGSMIPIGDYKGSGLALVVDMLAGVLTGSGFSGGVKPLNIDVGNSDNGHFILAINTEVFFDDFKIYFNKLKIITNEVRLSSSNKSKLPGENSYSNYSENVVWINENILMQIKSL